VSVPQADLLELVKFVVASPKAVAWSYGGLPRLVKRLVEAISRTNEELTNEELTDEENTNEDNTNEGKHT